MKRILLAVAAAVLVAAGCTAPPGNDPGGPPPAELSELEVAPEHTTGYDRDRFGDYDRDALLADSEGEHGCYRSTADNECYDTADAVHVDHLVALEEAWASGAHDWNDGRLDDFGGHEPNLWLMTAELNMSKQSSDPANWLPPHDPAVCSYAERWVRVKAEWGLTVDQAEHDALAATLDSC